MGFAFSSLRSRQAHSCRCKAPPRARSQSSDRHLTNQQHPLSVAMILGAVASSRLRPSAMLAGGFAFSIATCDQPIPPRLSQDFRRTDVTPIALDRRPRKSMEWEPMAAPCNPSPDPIFRDGFRLEQLGKDGLQPRAIFLTTVPSSPHLAGLEGA